MDTPYFLLRFAGARSLAMLVIVCVRLAAHGGALLAAAMSTLPWATATALACASLVTQRMRRHGAGAALGTPR